MWRKSKGAPLRDFFVFVQFLFGFNFDFQTMVFTDPEKFALVEIFIEEGLSYVRFVPAHYALRIRQLLNQEFPGRWMGRGSARHPAPVAWPPRSPDLTPLDFWVWGHLKQQIFTQDFRPRTIDELKDAIRRAVAELNEDEEVRVRVFGEFRRRLDECVRRGGQSVERR